ncbi:hypothetical protein M430DRAFT_134729 [Amorphotheca resinae ATCC 22711]|uniref:Uncharacterized protein n=1 Tax=Amorphotheca resinae ATCC 22711 TaxID=857342 RepID=A0A2T3BC47_AMORE|nr:hypothetical protein M430DRAFT_134729 [Amorphotheca resinae ATCC 22711]PSS25870.1 hypothetical protein M430DRAFT_134729 [Amorphotheca resinae ATCC 22711]
MISSVGRLQRYVLSPRRTPSSNQLTRSTDFWSVKFYPYTEPGVDPVFAAVGGKHILVCRLPSTAKEGTSIEVIQSVLDEEPDSDHFACVWTKDLSTGTPLLCVAGDNAKILIINALTGQLHRTLAGHGGAINDLAISPINPQILASASDDLTVRIWSLDPAHEKEPCAAILAGDGHREKVLTISFHVSGRYLLSGGVDHIINLWVLPEFPDSNTGTNKATRIHYPHFSTSEVHSGIVDCVAFHNDLILSKCHDEECIVLWAISGFSSANPPPSPLSAPTTHDSARDTRSAFTSPTSNPNTLQYTRLLQFAVPDSNIMFMRFGLYPGSATSNPVLAMCNTASKVFFWDLARLEEYHDFLTNLTAAGTNPTDANTPPRPSFLVPFRHRNRGPSALSRVRDTSPTDSTSTDSHSHSHTNTDTNNPPHSLETWAKRYAIGDPFEDLAAHKEEVVKGLGFVGRQIAWSRGGEWCVVVGSAGVIGVFERWRK